MDWRDMLLPGDWVILNNDREAVIVGKRDEYWIEIEGTEGEQKYQMIQASFIKSISKNLEHWFLAV